MICATLPQNQLVVCLESEKGGKKVNGK